MKISNSFRIPVPPEQAWVVLNDVPRVARCAPGAQLLEQRDDGAYVGTVGVRLGPVSLSFKGTFSYKEKDEIAHRVVAEAAGNEAKARGTARANVVFTLAPDPVGTKVDVETDLQLAGSIAQYGRGAALIQSTAQVLIDQFAANLAKEFAAGEPSQTSKATEISNPTDIPKLTEIPKSEMATSFDAPAPAPAEPAIATPPQPTQAEAISAGSLLWKAFLLWVKGIFGKRDA